MALLSLQWMVRYEGDRLRVRVYPVYIQGIYPAKVIDESGAKAVPIRSS